MQNTDVKAVEESIASMKVAIANNKITYQGTIKGIRDHD